MKTISIFLIWVLDRYLLRHETASAKLYEELHHGMKLENRKKCLTALQEIGYQVGAGFMVGLPGQSIEELALDLVFLKELNPHMVGIGPFIPHEDTPLGYATGGTIEKDPNYDSHDPVITTGCSTTINYCYGILRPSRKRKKL